MPLVPIALTNKSNQARYTQGGTASLVNCFAEIIGEEGRTQWAVYAADGLQGFVALPETSGGVRAAIEVNGVLWVVAGIQVYRVTSIGEVTLLGSMSISTSAPVYMVRNRRSDPDIGIVCDGLMYNIRAGVLSQVTDADLLAPTSLAFLDGYGVTSTANNTWQISAIDDLTAWDALDTERADADPDAVVRVAALQRDAVIFGEQSTEFHRNTGAADFPFERVASIDIGCLAANSVATVEQTLAWVANDRTVRMLNGYTGVRISTHAVERAIEDLADRSQITATSWVRDGHTFYSLSSPAWTWVYDTTTQLWHERKSYGLDLWRVSVVTTFGDRLIAGDRDSGILYEMSPDFADEAGAPLVLDMTMPPVHAHPKRLTVNTMYVDAERGVGTGQGTAPNIDPEIVLSWSKDGGHSFTGSRPLKLGQQGQRRRLLRTHRLGQAGDAGFVFRLQCSAKVARAIYGMSAEVETDEV